MDVLFGESAREKLLEGVRIAHNAVVKTFGHGSDKGYEIIKGLDVKDPTLEGGLFFVKNMANAVHKEYSGGVTLSVLLLYQLVKNNVSCSSDSILEQLKKQKRIATKETLIQMVRETPLSEALNQVEQPRNIAI